MMMNMMNDPGYNPRLAVQQRELDKLQTWYEREMDLLERQRAYDDITEGEYKRRVRELSREYDEDYADIFAG